ncbi:MAG: peptidoglycan DD-metalloendopeptidase family protein [Desulfobacterales bacterium]|nr:peptidoglycan DD-metalloendopeptidase family protein [Desulfobacterales bacterium]
MDALFKIKNIGLVGILLSLIFAIFALVNHASDLTVQKDEIQINLTTDILVNPILEIEEIWKVDQLALFNVEQDLSKNSLLDSGSSSIELFMQNAYKVIEEKPVNLTSVESIEPIVRPENLLVNVKSPRELRLLQAANAKVSIHQVTPGESLWSISRIYGIDLDTLIGSNQHIENIDKIKVGQELKILNVKGIIHKVSSYETLSNISNLYNVEIKKIMKHNNLSSSRLKVGQLLIIPDASPLDLECRSGFSEEFIWPLQGRISSLFGMRWGRPHNGVDIAVNIGTPVKAAKTGKVIFSGSASGYGKVVYIKHDSKTVTRYAHNNKLLVNTGDFVYQGQIISLSGNTGKSDGPHLHFEIRINDQPKDPLNYLKRK